MVKIHFLNVGHGDCTIIEHESGRVTMLDINNGESLDNESIEEAFKASSLNQGVFYLSAVLKTSGYYENLRKAGFKELTNPLRYYQDIIKNKPIFRYIQTHPDLDHMRGIRELKHSSIIISHFWDTNHTKTISEFTSDSDREDWEIYNAIRERTTEINLLKLNREAKGQYWNEHPIHADFSDGLHILAPTPELTQSANENENWNNHSYVIMLIYKGVRIIFGGDAEQAVWDSIVAGYGGQIKCDVLKASHHGRDTGYHQEAVKLMNPKYTIVSVGKKPDTDASNKYRQYSDNVLSTRFMGNITVTINDDGSYTLGSD